MGKSDKGLDQRWVERASWWLDHATGSFIVSIFTPLVTFFSWWLVLLGGTALRLLVERRRVLTRWGVFKKGYVMAGVQAAVIVLLSLDERPSLGLLLFWIVVLALLPTLLYVVLMPLAGQRWLSIARFTAWGRAQPSL